MTAYKDYVFCISYKDYVFRTTGIIPNEKMTPFLERARASLLVVVLLQVWCQSAFWQSTAAFRDVGHRNDNNSEILVKVTNEVLTSLPDLVDGVYSFRLSRSRRGCGVSQGDAGRLLPVSVSFLLRLPL